MLQRVRNHWRTAAVIVGSLGVAAIAVQAVTLRPYPQKIRTFYAADDPAVPPAVGEAGASLGGVKASDGAVWSGGPDGLWRVDEQAPVRDRRQYFAGRRYLPDDDVQRIVPDAAGGVWVRTRTGVSRMRSMWPGPM